LALASATCTLAESIGKDQASQEPLGLVYMIEGKAGKMIPSHSSRNAKLRLQANRAQPGANRGKATNLCRAANQFATLET
jgi:hypothetical protein